MSKNPYFSLPEVCVICGGRDRLRPSTIARTYVPGWVWLLLPLGVLPAAILGAIVQTKHRLTLQLCEPCASRRRWLGVVHWAALLFCILLLFGAAAAGIAMHSWFAFLGIIALACLVAFASGRFDAKAGPKYSVFEREMVEVDIPGQGRFVVFPPWAQGLQ